MAQNHLTLIVNGLSQIKCYNMYRQINYVLNRHVEQVKNAPSSLSQ